MKVLSWGFLAIGVVLIVAGVVSGDVVTVMRQAVTVCLECIGIG